MEGLRGASALAVLGYHALGFGAVAASYYRLGLGGGFAAVYVFFALSAFLLTRSPVKSWRDYYTHRLFRIFPTWLAVLPLFALAGIVPLSPWLFGLVQNWLPASAGIGNPTWTLSIELVFYACLPLWAWALGKSPYALATVCAAATLATAALHPPGFLAQAGLAPLSYASGSLAARGRLPRLGAPLSTAALLGGFAASTVWPVAAPAAVGLAAGFALVSLPKALARLKGFGSVAYPVYIAGYPVLFFARDLAADPWLSAALACAGTLALALLLHRLVEAPGIRLGQRAARLYARGALSTARTA